MNGNIENTLQYRSVDGKITIKVCYENGTFWLTQKAIADLFDTEENDIAKQLSNIYEEEELDKEKTCTKIAQIQTEGSQEVTKMVELYSLDAIIAVGYRVNSKMATKFRQWTTKNLSKYIQKRRHLNDLESRIGQQEYQEQVSG